VVAWTGCNSGYEDFCFRPSIYSITQRGPLIRREVIYGLARVKLNVKATSAVHAKRIAWYVAGEPKRVVVVTKRKHIGRVATPASVALNRHWKPVDVPMKCIAGCKATEERVGAIGHVHQVRLIGAIGKIRYPHRNRRPSRNRNLHRPAEFMAYRSVGNRLFLIFGQQLPRLPRIKRQSVRVYQVRQHIENEPTRRTVRGTLRRSGRQ